MIRPYAVKFNEQNVKEQEYQTGENEINIDKICNDSEKLVVFDANFIYLKI